MYIDWDLLQFSHTLPSKLNARECLLAQATLMNWYGCRWQLNQWQTESATRTFSANVWLCSRGFSFATRKASFGKEKVPHFHVCIWLFLGKSSSSLCFISIDCLFTAQKLQNISQKINIYWTRRSDTGRQRGEGKRNGRSRRKRSDDICHLPFGIRFETDLRPELERWHRSWSVAKSSFQDAYPNEIVRFGSWHINKLMCQLPRSPQ